MDIFPSHPSQVVPIAQHPETRSGFIDIRNRHNVVPALLFMEHGKVYFDTIPWTEQLSNHFLYVGKDSFGFNPSKLNTVSWDAIVKKLKKGKVAGLRNTDIRTCFTWANHMYLVKSDFTFGQRTVEPGFCHVYQTTAAPLLFYVLRSRAAAAARPRSLNGPDQFVYERFVLEPNSPYVVPEKTTYVIVALQKSLFAVHVIRGGCLLPFACRSPLETKKLTCEENPYRFAPMTPALDSLQQQQQQEEEQQPIPQDFLYTFLADMSPHQSHNDETNNDDSLQNPLQIDEEINNDDYYSKQNKENDSQNVSQNLQRSIQIVTPQFIDWYASMKTEYTQPPKLLGAIERDEEPLDLRWNPQLQEIVDDLLQTC